MTHVIWFVIWLAFALFILWLFARSLRTVLAQQRAWGQFARKHGLIYSRPLWYRPPSLDGNIQDRRFRLYVDEYVDPMRRVREFRTTIEVYFRNGFPTGLALGSHAYHGMLSTLENTEAIPLPAESEFTGILAVAHDPDLYSAYAAPRIDALKEFLGLTNAERLLMGHETGGFFAWQSAEPLADVKTLNARVKTLFGLADRLEPDLLALPVFDMMTEAVAEATAVETEDTNDTKEQSKEEDQE